jgi:hypothetical protein
MEAQRGAFWWDEDKRIAVVFGNDDYATDRRAKAEVEAVRRMIRGDGKELAFATSGSDGFSWALACEVPARLDLGNLTYIIWSTWLWLDAGKHSPEWESLPEQQESINAQIHIAEMVLERNGLI